MRKRAGRKRTPGWRTRHPGALVTWIAAVAGMLLAGCAQNELGRYSGYQISKWVVKDPKRIRNAIVKSENYWIQREVQPEEQFPGPTPDDLKAPEKDYILGPGDLIDITVFELMTPGAPYVSRQRISQSGQITFPYIGTVKCSGLTTRGLEEKLADLLSPDYLTDPQVSVFVQEYRNLNVSILNGVLRPGIYPMTGQDMTLLELIALAGGVLQLVEDYGYVIREYTPEEADLLIMEGGTAAKEEVPAKPAAEASPKDAEKPSPQPAGQPAADAPKPAEKAAPASPAPASPPAAPGGAASPAPAPKAAADDATRQVRELLEKMASGEMPPVSRIEKAEAAASGQAARPAADKPAPPRPVAVWKAPKDEARDARVAMAGAPASGAASASPSPAAPAAPAAPASNDEKELGRWIWSDGKWVEVKPEAPKAPSPPKAAEPAKPAAPAKPEAPAGPAPSQPAAPSKPGEPVRVVESPVPAKPAAEGERLRLEEKLRRLGVVQGSGQLKRIIRFDVRALQSGDPTQNVVLRDGDIVTIPSPQLGDFYMVGEVARPGVYSLTGRKITLLQAVAAAGGLTAVAVPWRTELVRRVSELEEEIIYLDLLKISRGEAPDIYLQPEDNIRVGTDQGAIFNAVIRNAFRATYGLGFVYDMNFADFYPWTDRVRPIFDELF